MAQPPSTIRSDRGPEPADQKGIVFASVDLEWVESSVLRIWLVAALDFGWLRWGELAAGDATTGPFDEGGSASMLSMHHWGDPAAGSAEIGRVSR